jgi:hypothetical protein
MIRSATRRPVVSLVFRNLYRSQYISPHFFFSTSTPPADGDSSTLPPSDKIPSIPFPWRSNATQPLPRLSANDDLSGLKNTARSRFAKKVTAGLEMKTPMWQLFVTKSWEKELAQNCAVAFKNAVAGLLSKTFQVPLLQIENTDEFVRYDSTVSNKDTKTMQVGEDGENNETVDKEGASEDDVVTAEETESEEQYIRAMIEENLLKLYTSESRNEEKASLEHDDDEKENTLTEVFMSVKPIDSRLESMFLIPSLTRDDVKENESLRGAYREIESTFQETGDLKMVSDMANELIKKVKHGGKKRSIIIDVSIDCLERFYVKAGQQLIQGDDDSKEKEVTHLVRFEMQTTKGETVQDKELGSWYIIDIDDQLEGNVWH